MILNLVLSVDTGKGSNLLPFNYQYPLSAAIYNIIKKGDTQYNYFLHHTGYGANRLKLFTFSDIIIRFICKGDRMLLQGKNALLKVCFHIDEAAGYFVKGLFMEERLVIGDQKSQVHFRIQEVENYLPLLPVNTINNMVNVVLEPISPMVVGSPNPNTSITRFYSPYEKIFIERLLLGWIKKYKVVSGLNDKDIESIKSRITIEVQFYDSPPWEKTITIKDGLPSSHKIRGYIKFRLKITAPKAMVELALNSGLGLKNSMGMGCVQLIQNNEHRKC